MPISEIEVNTSSISFKCWNIALNSVENLFNQIETQADIFTLSDELPGFHDFVYEDNIIRGFYSIITPFEVEHLVDDILTKTLFKRIETCEFFITEENLFTTGKPAPMKGLAQALANLTKHEVTQNEFEFEQLNLLQERMAQVKSIVLTNPKDKEIRRARLAGKIESYTEYNIIDPRNHEIESVSGLIESPIGIITVTITKKGAIRLNLKKGTIFDIANLKWILALTQDEKRPQPIINENKAPF